MPVTGTRELERLSEQYPDKFLPENEVFAHIRRGDRIFLGTACGGGAQHSKRQGCRAAGSQRRDAEK